MPQKYSNYHSNTNRKNNSLKKMMFYSLVVVSLIYLFTVSLIPISFFTRVMFLSIIFMLYTSIQLFFIRFLADFKVKNNVAIIEISNKKMIVPITRVKNNGHIKFAGLNFSKVKFTLDGKKHSYFYVSENKKVIYSKSNLRVA